MCQKMFTLLVTFRKHLKNVSEKMFALPAMFFPIFHFFKNVSSFFREIDLFDNIFDKRPQLSSQISLKIA